VVGATPGRHLAFGHARHELVGAEFAIAAVSDALMPVGDVTGALQVGNIGCHSRRALSHRGGRVATWAHL